MARIRSIKPEFWTDEKIVGLSAFARLLFVGMWNFVDDDGRAEFSPMRLKMQILPADDVDAGKLLDELLNQHLVTVYEVEGRRYLQVVNFAKHQKVDKRAPSKFPPPSQNSAIPRQTTPPSPEVPRVSPSSPDGREGKGREEEGKKDSGANAPSARARKPNLLPLPADWKPDEADFEYGQGLGLTPRQVTERGEDMRLWALSKAERKADWRATFQGFLRRTDKPSTTGPPQRSAKPMNGWEAILRRGMKPEPEQPDERNHDLDLTASLVTRGSA